MNVYLLTVGFISILGQVLVLRELNVAFYGVELIYILAMGVWLLWTATGALIGRRSYVPSPAVIGYLFIIFGTLLPLDVAFIRGARILFGGIPGSYLPFLLQLAVITFALLPVGILLGLLFQWAAKIYIVEGKTLAVAYAVESVGGLVGGLASTLLLKFGIQNFAIAILCSLLTVGILLFPGKNRQHRIQYASMPVFGILLVAFLLSPKIDHRMTRWSHPNLFDTRDSPYSRITITEQEGQFVVFENDAIGFETESTTAEELVHLAAVHQDDLDRILILGGGVDGLLGEILKHAPQTVDYVELNPVLLELAGKYLPESHQAPFESKVVTVFNTDPRSFLKNGGSYDLILTGMAEPTSGQANRFYTLEFFEQCLSNLKPNGILAFRLRSSENIWTQFITYRNTSIYRSLKSIFSDVLVLPGVTNIIIASNNTLSRDPDILAKRFSNRKIETRLITPEYIEYLYTNDRFFEITKRLALTEIPPNTDATPICYRFSSMIWLSKFFPKMINWNIGLPRTWLHNSLIPYIAIICLGCLFLLVRRRPKLQRIMLAALAGLFGMVLETILILHYQVKSGVLYQNLGILLMVFMSGLALGSFTVFAVTKTQITKYGTIRRKLGCILFIGFAIISTVFIGISNLDYPSGIFVVSLLLLATGFLVSGIFAFASLSGVKNQKSVVSPLYAADLLGGCIGSLVGSLLLIPFFGMVQTAAIIGVLALAALLLF